VGYICPAVTCRLPKCFKHCNHCGKEIRWRPSKLDREIAYAGPKPLNLDDSLHRCMLQGTKGRGYFKTDSVNQKYYKGGYTTSEIEAMRDTIILAVWNKQRDEFLAKWETKE
jgi:hypothetical protein